MTAAIGAVVGGTVGDSAFEAQLAGVVGQNAVENNVDSYKDIQNAKAYSEKMYKDTCAAYGLGEPACGNRIRKEGLEILQETAMIFVPTSVYEIIPIGKGVGIVVKGTKKIVAVYKDAKSAEKAAEKAKVKIENNIHRDDDLWSNKPSGRQEYQEPIVKNAIPNAESVIIDPKKLTSYALNKDHPVGGHKAKVLESALGYNQKNANELIKKVQEGVRKNEAIVGKTDQHGQSFFVDIPITGPNGNTAIVRTGWIIDKGSKTPRLATLYVNK